MTTDDGFICGFHLDGQGGGSEINWREIEHGLVPNGIVWAHFNRLAESSRIWLREKSQLDDAVVEAMLAEETRPHCTLFPGGVFINLRGINQDSGQEPRDMVSMRVWVEERKIISCRSYRLQAALDIRNSLINGYGPRGPGDFLVELAAGLVDRMGSVVSDVADEVDAFEDEVLAGESAELRPRLGVLRRQTISLRRYISPQREALLRLAAMPVPWITADHRTLLREVENRTTRQVEDLDAARERAAVVQDELAAHLAEKSHRTMYLLSVIAGIFLPLGLVSGLLGINVGGIPGTGNPFAFGIVCILIVIVALFEVWLLRKFKWF